MAIKTLTLPLLLNLAYRIGVFYAATKIIPSLYQSASYPLITPPKLLNQVHVKFQLLPYQPSHHRQHQPYWINIPN